VETSLPDDYRYLTFIGDDPPPMARQAWRVRRRSTPIRSASLDAPSLAFFDALLGTRGMSASAYRDSILTRRRAACLRAIRAATPAEGIRVLQRDAAAAERALGSLMIGVTDFFRDPAVFASLRPLLRSLTRSDGPVRVLSVGCSDGAEVYSLAMLLAEDGLLGDTRLYGLDSRRTAIASARAGTYPAAALATVPAELRRRYFEPSNADGRGRGLISGKASPALRVIEPLRAASAWFTGDALRLNDAVTRHIGADVTLDVILCRNLAIYLTPDAADELWNQCIDRLRPGGLIVTGKAERPPTDARSGLRRLAACIYRRS
jgi:chemotaxis protein methyltransferase CheR